MQILFLRRIAYRVENKGQISNGSGILFRHVSVPSAPLPGMEAAGPSRARRADSGPRAALSAEAIVEMRGLREENPEAWTQGKLAERFGVSKLEVLRHAPLPAAVAERLRDSHEAQQRKEAEKGRSKYYRRQPHRATGEAFSVRQLRNRRAFTKTLEEAGQGNATRGLKKFIRENNADPAVTRAQRTALRLIRQE